MTAAALVAAIVGRIDALSGWNESAYLYDGIGLDPTGYAHKAFQVGCPESQAQSGRQRGGTGLGVWTRSRVVVRFTATVRPKDGPVSWREALALEDEITRQITLDTDTWPGAHGPRITFDRADRAIVGTWSRHDLTFNADHWVELT